MPDILILADDLSGAADCGIACVKFGLDAAVSLGEPSTAISARTVAVDADTRVLTAEAAAARMFDLTRAWGSDPATLLFKKIDSTLRGHLGPELAAVLAARRITVPSPIAVMAPAFPAIGRTTRDALHFVHGQPLHLTDTWRNEKMTGEAHIPSMLANAKLRCTHVDLAALHGLGRPSPNAFAGTDVLICDAVDDNDLRAVAEIAAALGPRAIWVGSAGLAYHLPHAAGFVSPANSRINVMHFAPPPTDRPTLFVLGSASRRTWDQATVLLSSSDIHGVVIPPETLLAGPGTADWQAFATDLYTAIDAGLDVVLLCDSQPRVPPEDRPTLSLALAEMTASLRDRVGTLIASGGETARKVLDRWGVRSMELHGELETGVPISSATLDPTSTITIITKAGDFGQHDTLLRALLWAQQATSPKPLPEHQTPVTPKFDSEDSPQ